jgi:D-inositol-3-phosphate glycosyltransferase
VVATAVDGARELVLEGRTGRLVACDDPAAIAAGVASVLSLSKLERESLGAAGRERVAGRYSSRAMAEGLIGVYREVA